MCCCKTSYLFWQQFLLPAMLPWVFEHELANVSSFSREGSMLMYVIKTGTHYAFDMLQIVRHIA